MEIIKKAEDLLMKRSNHMLEIFKTTIDGKLEKIDDFQQGCWINLISPSDSEINRVVGVYNISPDFLKDPLDDDERSRIEVNNNQTLIIVDIPIIEEDSNVCSYETIPLGMIVTEEVFITVCLKENPIINDFKLDRVKGFFTFKKTRFVLQILFKTATFYLRYLRQINKTSDEVERHLHKSLKNEELFALLSLEKSLVYFTTSLRANEIVMEKLLRSKTLRMYPEDEDILEDVIIENKQAIEMTHIYSNILSGMMDAYASVISNNLNMVMKTLTLITIAIAIPTMVSSFFGMNITNHFENSYYGFPIIVTFSILLSAVIMYIMFKRKQF